MKYYVPVGVGGMFFGVGMAVTGMIGSVVYWRASRCRDAERPRDVSLPTGHPPRFVLRPDEPHGAIMVGSSCGSTLADRLISQ